MTKIVIVDEMGNKKKMKSYDDLKEFWIKHNEDKE